MMGKYVENVRVCMHVCMHVRVCVCTHMRTYERALDVRTSTPSSGNRLVLKYTYNIKESFQMDPGKACGRCFM